MKLSLCVMAKDSASAERCVSTFTVADETILVDGDDTSSWNAALRKATGDWVLLLDECETLSPTDRQKVKGLLSAVKHDAFSFKLPPETALRETVRLFRNRIGLQFSGKTPSLGKSIKDAFAKVGDSGISIQSFAMLERQQKAAFLFRSAFAAVKAGKSEEAIDPLTEANRLDSFNVEVTNLLGVAYAQLGKRDKALRCFTTALKVPPAEARTVADRYPYANIFANIGDLMGMRGQHAKAIVAYEKAISLGHPKKELLLQRVELLKKAADEKPTFSYSLSLGAGEP